MIDLLPPGLALMLGWFACYFLELRPLRKSQSQADQANDRHVWYHQRLYLDQLCREYARILTDDGADQFVKNEISLVSVIEGIGEGHTSANTLKQELEAKYTDITDFDVIGLKHYIAFPYTIFAASIDEIMTAYSDAWVYSFLLESGFEDDFTKSRAEHLVLNWYKSDKDQFIRYINERE